MTHIGIVGAGAGAAGAAYELAQRRPDADVTVLEKSRGVCGRAATRRREGCTYDYGANYVRSEDERVNDLLTEDLDADGLVDVTDPIYTFDGAGAVSEGRPPDGPKWTYRRGITQLAKRLFAETDATVERETRVETIRKRGESWTLVDADGASHGPFDAVVLNPPAPQSAELLADADWDAPVRGALRDAAAAVPYRTIWTAVLHYPFALSKPYYALVNPERDHEVGWVAREACKPGHVPDGESLLVVQANDEWSRAHYDADPDANVAALAGVAADLLDDERLRDPDWTDHQGWRYALPDAGLDADVRRRAEAEGLYPVGDWVGGAARVHVALRSGLEVGERLADAG
ncbi:NAD/FAD-dependent oxidoreductase [Halarchaeum grantii]|uniref:NAD/FAD-dependent oxidoreductase n=1 Tax=Halarchaeum grantii TaxID=1193105 RepID=A0A830EWK9_9EURY|nr:FAD-dependent oxidoreductase [Halarchaeum grantii]GGL37127.1 NAD/FAD-dependent oxidoreductase [Halarchaeum grantii]